MKTPQEILLQRHQSVNPKLNAIRQNVVASLATPEPAQTWRGLLFSLRWHLAGMGAVWMTVVLLSMDSTPVSPVVLAAGEIPSPRVLLTALLNNRRELIELTETPVAVEPVVLPPRRSDIRSTFETV